MKKFIIAGVAALIAAVGAWFGIPVYADGEFKGALDGYFAGKTDERTGYQNAKLDYWKDQAEVGAVTDVVTVDVGGETLRMLVTFNDLVIEGYDLDAASTASAGADGKIEQLAERISWSGFTMVDEASGGKLTGKAGTLSGVKADKLDLNDLLGTIGAEFSDIKQADVRFDWQEGTDSIKAGLGALAVRDARSGGLSALNISNLSLGGTFAKDEVSGDFSMDWGSLALTDLKIGDLVSVQRAETNSSKARFNILAPNRAGGAPEPVAGNFSYDTYFVENADLNPEVFNIYPKFFELLKRPTGEPKPEEIAQVFEFFIAMMEDVVAKNTGMDVFEMTNLVIDVPKLQTQTIERISAQDYRGLKVGFMKISSVKQTTPVGATTSIDSLSYEGADLSALPAYLRTVLGDVVTPDSLVHAQNYYRDSTIAAAIPAITFGRWSLKNQNITLPNDTGIVIGDVLMVPMRADASGQVQFATIVSGIDLPMDKLAQSDPRAGAVLAMLQAQGIKQLSLGYGIDVTASPKAGTVNIDDLSVALKELAAVNISGKISGIDVEDLRKLPEQEWAGPLMQSGIGGLTIEAKDEGLRAVALKAFSEQRGGTPDQIAEGLAAQAEQLAAQLGSVRAASIGKALAAFLREGGSLKVTTAKTDPIPIIDIMMATQTQGPPAVLELLEIEAVHTP
jgi:hypothetical protein